MIVFDDLIADIINNKKLNPVVTEWFIRVRKLNMSMVFITESYVKVPKDLRLNSTHFFIMKTPNKRELQQTALNLHQIFTLKISLRSIKNVLQNHIPFWIMMQFYHQIIL